MSVNLCSKAKKHNPANHWEGSRKAKDCPWGRRWIGFIDGKPTFETNQQVIERNKSHGPETI